MRTALDTALKVSMLAVTRAVLLTALMGLALAAVGAVSIFRQQSWGADACGDEVWNVSIAGAGTTSVWSSIVDGVQERAVTVLATGADPGLVHVTGPAASCLTGITPADLDEARSSGTLFVLDGSGFADRVRQGEELGGVPAVVVPTGSWRGPGDVVAVQPTPHIDASSVYTGLLVGDHSTLSGAVDGLRTAGLTVEAVAAPSPWAVAVGGPVVRVTAVLTGLTLVSVTAYWALALRSRAGSGLRVLRLIGLSPGRSASTLWRWSAVPFAAASVVACVVWGAVWFSGPPVSLSGWLLAGVAGAVLAADGVIVILTHMAALWMRQVPR